MVSNGGLGGAAPEPPEGSRELPPGPVAGAQAHELHHDEDSDDEMLDYYEGYEPLPLAPTEDGDLATWDSQLMSEDSDDDEMETAEPVAEETPLPPQAASDGVPNVETVEREVTREVWTTPRVDQNIQMDPEKAQEVMSAMANFSLPTSSFPEWAHCISEEEWKLQLAKRINLPEDNR